MVIESKVLIVGGSFAGLHIAYHLKNIAQVTLVDPKDYFEYSPGVSNISYFFLLNIIFTN